MEQHLQSPGMAGVLRNPAQTTSTMAYVDIADLARVLTERACYWRRQHAFASPINQRPPGTWAPTCVMGNSERN